RPAADRARATRASRPSSRSARRRAPSSRRRRAPGNGASLPGALRRSWPADREVNRRDILEIAVAVTLVAAAAAAHFAHATPVLAFIGAAIAIAVLARLVGSATEQLGSRLGSSAAGVIQSALGNLPELFIALFALNAGLTEVVQSALVGSVIANGVLVLGIAFLVGGVRNGTQR